MTKLFQANLYMTLIFSFIILLFHQLLSGQYSQYQVSILFQNMMIAVNSTVDIWTPGHSISLVQSENAKEICYIINRSTFTLKYVLKRFVTRLSSDTLRKKYKFLTDYNGFFNLINYSTGASEKNFYPISNKRFDHLKTLPTIHRPKKVFSAGSLCVSLFPSPQSKCPEKTFILPQKYHASVSNMLS